MLTLIISTQGLIPRIYTIDDVLIMYKDYITLTDDINKIPSLKEYSAFLLKLINKIDDRVIQENIEWLLYTTYSVYENESLDEKNSFLLKSIYDEVNVNISYNKNKLKTFIMSSLIELISKKIIN